VQSLRGRERKGAASAKNNNRKNKYQKWFCRRIHSFPSSNFFDFYSFGRVAETREFQLVPLVKAKIVPKHPEVPEFKEQRSFLSKTSAADGRNRAEVRPSLTK